MDGKNKIEKVDLDLDNIPPVPTNKAVSDALSVFRGSINSEVINAAKELATSAQVSAQSLGTISRVMEPLQQVTLPRFDFPRLVENLGTPPFPVTATPRLTTDLVAKHIQESNTLTIEKMKIEEDRFEKVVAMNAVSSAYQYDQALWTKIGGLGGLVAAFFAAAAYFNLPISTFLIIAGAVLLLLAVIITFKKFRTST